MRYFIAGGGDYGTMYLSRLEKAHTNNKIYVDEIVVIDKNINCKAARVLPKTPPSRLDTTAWECFGEFAWTHREELENDVWIPAPIAPHIIAGWILERLETHFKMNVLPINLAPDVLPVIPYAHTLSDGRILLSHAVDICPIGCIEPGRCALTKGPRWWEMKDTISDLIRSIRSDINVETVGYFFCQHHCDADGYEVGGISMKTIFEEADRIFQVAAKGRGVFGIATLSSCHGVLNLYEASMRHWTEEPREKRCERCGMAFNCGSGAPGGCWCDSVPVLRSLPEDVTECLCAECLGTEIKRQSNN